MCCATAVLVIQWKQTVLLFKKIFFIVNTCIRDSPVPVWHFMYTVQTKFVAHVKDPTYHHYKSFPQTCWCPNADGMENPQPITMENPSILGNPAYYGGISGTPLWFILIRKLVITFSCQYQGKHDSSVPHTFSVHTPIPPPTDAHPHTLTLTRAFSAISMPTTAP